MVNYLQLKVAQIIRETSDTVSVHFFNPEGEKLKFTPGQYLTLCLTINGKEERRPYSLCSSPEAGELPAVAVKRVEGGLVSNYILDHLQVGETITVIPPQGNFGLPINTVAERHIVLIGAGSGITPLFSILKSVLTAEANSMVTLIYGNRKVESIIFREHLEKLQKQWPQRLRVIHCLSSPPEKWYGASGRIHPDMLKEIIEQSQPVTPMEETQYFLCGPQGMMETTEETLKSMGVPKKDIHKESFFHNVDTEAVEQLHEEAGLITREVKIIFDDEEFSFPVSPDETILQAALDRDIRLPYSCQSGLCTACRCKTVSGKILMDEREGLSDAEFDEGYVLICVGHPLTADVVLTADE